MKRHVWLWWLQLGFTKVCCFVVSLVALGWLWVGLVLGRIRGLVVWVLMLGLGFGLRLGFGLL